MKEADINPEELMGAIQSEYQKKVDSDINFSQKFISKENN
jgi:hypothetical protein